MCTICFDESTVHRADDARGAALAWGSNECSESSFFVARGRGLATCARTYAPFIWVVNPVAETYRVESDCLPPTGHWAALPPGHRYVAIAYTTLDGHLLAGEERLAVVKDGPNSVVAHILSISRGSGLAGRLVYPFVGPMQRRFFRAQLNAIERTALQDSPTAM